MVKKRWNGEVERGRSEKKRRRMRKEWRKEGIDIYRPRDIGMLFFSLYTLVLSTNPQGEPFPLDIM